MLIREGDERSATIDLRLAAILSFVAGALNAAGFELAGVFSANMTGNVSAMADNLARGAVGVGLLLGLLVLVFVGGTFCAGVAIETGRRRGLRWIYALTILAEGLVLLAVALGHLTGLLPLSDMGLILVLGFVLGVQNATTTRVSRARVRTTHVSGMATDIGLSAAALVAGAGDRGRHAGGLVLHVTTITAFLVGGIVGATVLAGVGTVTFLLCGLALVVVAGAEMIRDGLT